MTDWHREWGPEGLGAWTPYRVDGTGNRFALIDALDGGSADAFIHAGPEWARGLTASDSPWRSAEGRPMDGLILLLPPQGEGDLRMVIFNADGSRPEACGNALRCLVRVAFDMGRVGRPRFVVETDAGSRAVDALEAQGPATRVSMGPPRLIRGRVEIEVNGRTVSGVSISMGNPHFVVDLNSVTDGDVSAIGAAISIHPEFPQGTNVEFLFGDVVRPRVRVWERGVGETEACGSGACAVAHSLYGSSLIHKPLRLDLPGGELLVGRDTHGLWLEGFATWEPVGHSSREGAKR
ncbi:MAG: diaminopimelate epimerase [Planctomycetes bacterium]|nr:diaminopimelate epimerase [Planctomycetota bacterium]